MEQNSELEQALGLTRRLLQLAVDGDWEEAPKLEAERFRLLRQGVAGVAAESPETGIELLREIQALDQKILAIGRKQRDDLRRRLRGLHTGRKAEKSYRQEGRP